MDTAAKKILCVDHDDQTLSMLALILNRSGYQFSLAHSREVALSELNQNADLPDLILLDLPAEETWALCQQLHQSPTLSLIPLVLVDTVHSAQEKQKAMALGAVDFLAKPISQKHLLDVVERHCEIKDQWMQNFLPATENIFAVSPEPIISVPELLHSTPEIMGTAESPVLEDSLSNQALKWTEFQAFIDQNLNGSAATLSHFSSNQLYHYADLLKITGDELAKLVAEFLHLSYLDNLDNLDIALGLIPTAFCKKNMILPIRSLDGGIAFVVSNPFDIETMDLLKNMFKSFELFMTSPTHINKLFLAMPTESKTASNIHVPNPASATASVSLDEHEHLKANQKYTNFLSSRKSPSPPMMYVQNLQEKNALELEKKLIHDYLEKQNRQTEQQKKDKHELDLYLHTDENNQEIAPIIQLVDMLIVKAHSMGASDIHIEPAEHEIVVRYRIDGELKTINRLQPHALIFPLIARIKIMSRMNIVEHRLPQDGRITFSEFFPDLDFDLRVAITPMNYGEKAVLRILDKKKTLLSLDKLGYSPYNIQIYREKIKTPYGMILHVGPTGSGKSMTLYSALNEILSDKINIQTIEDPIEYTLPGISQLEVRSEIGLTFARGLRAFLRQDPDVILVGEIRDQETARIAVEASLTGHLLLSTLHTNDAPSTVIRLIEMGIDNYLLSSSLVLICAQRLLRRLCLNCRAPYRANRSICNKLGLDETEKWMIYRPVGCLECNQTGYKGRIGVHEVLVFNEFMRTAINDPKVTSEYLKKIAVEKCGMITLYWDAMEKVKMGITSLEEALAKIKTDEFDSRPANPSSAVGSKVPVVDIPPVPKAPSPN